MSNNRRKVLYINNEVADHIEQLAVDEERFESVVANRLLKKGIESEKKRVNKKVKL